jgi:hypothetical protein
MYYRTELPTQSALGSKTSSAEAHLRVRAMDGVCLFVRAVSHDRVCLLLFSHQEGAAAARLADGRVMSPPASVCL